MSEKAKFRAKVRKDNRITIPHSIRESEDIENGDFVDVLIEKIDKS